MLIFTKQLSLFHADSYVQVNNCGIFQRMVEWCSWLSRQSNTLKVSGSSPGSISSFFFCSLVAFRLVSFFLVICWVELSKELWLCCSQSINHYQLLDDNTSKINERRSATRPKQALVSDLLGLGTMRSADAGSGESGQFLGRSAVIYEFNSILGNHGMTHN